jgi:CRISPR-associated exonuclease Cas4
MSFSGLDWLVASGVIALVVGVLLVLGGRGMRRGRGLGAGRTVSLDNFNLYSARLALVGRPDRIVRNELGIIPEEWKSAKTLRAWHRAQMGVYFVLIEEQLGVRPPFGNVVCGDGKRYRVENTEELRAWVLDLAEKVRSARRQVERQIPVNPKPGQCRPCGLRAHCNQARV